MWFVGNTAEITDLKAVTDRDQIRIDSLVMLGVYLILVVLLRRPGICAYLMFTVLYSYFATLGFTYLAFWAMDPAGFTGLDWKVPMFLFTILIAVGEDYNIFLMARIEEEQKVHGPLKGITIALERTGSIISSCGIIMAGTFSSLMAGSLVGMDQLGLALATGVVLDTFVIRPIMVPAFLVLLTTHRLGPISRMAGYGAANTVPRAA
jgi:RND superfamily putative drug exporter